MEVVMRRTKMNREEFFEWLSTCPSKKMFFINDERDFDVMKFPDNSVIRQFKSAANWQDNKGDYGHLECMGHYTSIISEGTSLKNYCYGKNQKDEEFWFTMERNS